MKTNAFMQNLNRGEKFAIFGTLGVAGVIVFGALFGLLVQFLWNSTLVELFGIAEITFWQSLGVLVLAKLFFGFGSSGSSSKKSGKSSKSDPALAESAAEPATDDEELLGQDEFRDYWQREGRAAYEKYRDDESVRGSE